MFFGYPAYPCQYEQIDYSPFLQQVQTTLKTILLLEFLVGIVRYSR
ncbi:hypothetical protein BC624_109111 [Flavobacterium granuli]|uniref:Uncharacterized protein n=1 Tax=Flavobacterium granuli TaxID=280093 RepID=A0A1M5S9P1_9FLAO|nr:hypothetical protein BC624_109111 [Flavobacterium granuli]SHH35199.1 hypothetical protein SAMN05443373_111111 [Flavobacterium granuli]